MCTHIHTPFNHISTHYNTCGILHMQAKISTVFHLGFSTEVIHFWTVSFPLFHVCTLMVCTCSITVVYIHTHMQATLIFVTLHHSGLTFHLCSVVGGMCTCMSVPCTCTCPYNAYPHPHMRCLTHADTTFNFSHLWISTKSYTHFWTVSFCLHVFLNFDGSLTFVLYPILLQNHTPLYLRLISPHPLPPPSLPTHIHAHMHTHTHLVFSLACLSISGNPFRSFLAVPQE